jgi:hypothetical protein
MGRRTHRTGLAMSLVGAILVLAPIAPKHRARAQGDSVLVFVDTIEVGGSPDAIVVDNWAGRNDVIFYDTSDGGKVRFIDGDTLTLAPEEIAIPTWEWEGWMAYDRYHHQTYVLSTELRWPTPETSWEELAVHIVASRSLLGSFSVNEVYNRDAETLADAFYGVDGLEYKQPFSEGSTPGRLIIDDTKNGNVDVVDLNATGTDAARLQRHSYRDPTPGGWSGNLGNSLALETRHETLEIDDLTSTDILYISDKNHSEPGHIRVLSLNHPLEDLVADPLPQIDLTSNCGIGGCQGIAVAAARDVLYVASGDQYFDTGYIDQVDTTNSQLVQLVSLTYGDLYSVHVDWYDSRRAFVASFDHYGNDPSQGLYVHLIYDGTVIDTLRLVEDYGEYEAPLRGMAFDPYQRRLYLTVGSSVMVVQVNYGAEPAPPSPIVASAIIPPAGGSLSAPGNRAYLEFPPGAVGQTTVVTYTETGSSPATHLFDVRAFDLSAVISGTTTPVTSFNEPYTVTINYTDAERGPAIESTLGLYWWDGTQWLGEPTSRVDGLNNSLMATPNHMTLFAALGETKRGYVPFVSTNR